ncbi:FMN-binding protein [Sunxiuqinia elliptica]|uniref:FMN-binding protein n=1 Tax=Sunxiuqinia elliptica TaxID=655355 RepID=A0A4R6GXD2_9BACT|nr:FMN-binding protein [Sunxiuqinia elliptica]TDN99997.1 FMN-binding protein [Sunxiuqinia elliptica]TDO57189.1 FMN-binding protein [Sunxiuqinia elliptica]
MIAMLGLLLMTTSQAQLFGADDAASKKLVKLLSKELHVDRSDLEFEKVSTAECLQTEQVESVLRVYKAGKPTGFVVSAIGKGRYDQFNYLVYYNEDREVKLVNVTAYFSDHGNEITSKRWLKQFNGYDGGDLDYGDEVQAISGATLSASSIVKGIREITILLQDCNL